MAQVLSLDEEEGSTELDALENKSSAVVAPKVVAVSALTSVQDITEADITEALKSIACISRGIRTNVADDGGGKQGSNT